MAVSGRLYKLQGTAEVPQGQRTYYQYLRRHPNTALINLKGPCDPKAVQGYENKPCLSNSISLFDKAAGLAARKEKSQMCCIFT